MVEEDENVVIAAGIDVKGREDKYPVFTALHSK